MPDYRKAFLDALAEGESGGDYSILCGGGHFDDFSQFPDWDGIEGPAGISHAAGKFQFEPRTWAECAARLGLKDFSPAAQDAAAWDLAQRVYWAVKRGNLLTVLAMENDLALAGVATALHSTWTSLSPKTFPVRFRTALAEQDQPEPVVSDNLAPADTGVIGFFKRIFGAA